ncbi:MAG: Z1 domain-containing protein [Myxococcota bacterium]
MSQDEVIRVVAAGERSWEPSAGPLSHGVVRRKLGDDPGAQNATLVAAQEILSQCNSPSADSEGATGLVVGYVQSGKTLSFTTVAAMAADNDFQLVIVIAGTTTKLADQSQERLTQDLGIEESTFPSWYHIHNPEPEDATRIRDVLAQWKMESVPKQDRRTVLVTVLKNHRRLENLFLVLERLEAAIGQVPSLIIDDEADQASLNTLVRRGELSTTYLNINLVRALLPRHTFLQYTATPQAVLLINLIDVLSPEFAHLLEPGSDYVGGPEFFADGSPLVAGIPPADIPSAANPLVDPPDSLERAMQVFFLGVASGRLRRDEKPKNRSMMIHPSKDTGDHTQFYGWVQAITRLWADILDLPPGDSARAELEEEFRRAHAELSRTVEDLETFEELQVHLLSAISNTELRLVNSLRQANREIKWNREYSWILVGGQVLDRGFTIEGLTVTYMPRGPGVWNADTIQQRARFFGYKRPYLGFCRVFLDTDVIRAYQRYVVHEDDVRGRLAAHVESGQSLRDLRRAFLLDRRLQPTRANVIDVDYARPLFRDGWCILNSPHRGEVDANRESARSFMLSNADRFEQVEGHPGRRDDHLHDVAYMRLAEVYSDLLVDIRVSDAEDSRKYTAALVMLDRWLSEHEGEMCAIYRMRPNFRARRQVRNDKIVRLLQGAHRDSAVYGGDRSMRDTNVTLQLHLLTLTDGPVRDDASTIVCEDVLAPVFWLSDEVVADVLVQDQ